MIQAIECQEAITLIVIDTVHSSQIDTYDGVKSKPGCRRPPGDRRNAIAE